MIEKVLIADDEPILRRFIGEVLSRKKLEVHYAIDGQEAIEKLDKIPFELVITDLMMPKKNGIEVLQTIKKTSPQTLVILMTAHATVEKAVEAMQLGAFNFLLKPFSPECLEINFEKANNYLKQITENNFLKEEHISASPLIAQSSSMKKIISNIEKIAKSNASVFISGESGTGKEVIASYIHQQSPRKDHPFIKVNCAAIPDPLIESEFFGHEKGAFTGAVSRKIGRFELADKGTLLLDEVTEIPIGMQAKLLRAIQEMEFERVGSSKSIQVNTRLIATSNRHMFEAIENKVFREDLYYRLNVMPIHLPPLRERLEDIQPLAEFFIQKFCKENHKLKKTLTPKAIDKLLSYHWPGNVRELANIIERVIVLDFDTIIEPDHIFLDSPIHPTSSYHPGMTLHEMEKKMILDTLEAQGLNRGKTASILGISVRTLRNKLHEYGTFNQED